MQGRLENQENNPQLCDSCSYFIAFPTILSTFVGRGLHPVALENVTLFSGQTRSLYLDVGNLPEYTAEMHILLGSLDVSYASQRQMW